MMIAKGGIEGGFRTILSEFSIPRAPFAYYNVLSDFINRQRGTSPDETQVVLRKDSIPGRKGMPSFGLLPVQQLRQFAEVFGGKDGIPAVNKVR
jgi:hypothetical protein